MTAGSQTNQSSRKEQQLFERQVLRGVRSLIVRPELLCSLRPLNRALTVKDLTLRRVMSSSPMWTYEIEGIVGYSVCTSTGT